MKLKYNDEHHSYWLDGKRCKGVTTVAKIPDDTYRLELWAKRQVAIGLASSPALVELVAAHFDDDKRINDACEKAMEAAKASKGADRGTAAHRITERHDLGEPIMDTPLAAYVVGSWKAALEAVDLEVVPEYIERIVVYPDLRIAGRLDRILHRRSDGRLFIADVKGGERALKYPHSMAIQCGLYANAPLLAGPLPAAGGETETFEPMPDVDKTVAYIFHLPESGEAAVASVDIGDAWKLTERAVFPVMQWRDRRDLCQPVAKVGGGEPFNPPGTATPAVDVGGGEPEPPTPQGHAATPADPQRRQALIDHIKRLPDVEREELAHRWPLGVPTFKQSTEHTDAELDAIAAMIDNVDWSPRPQPEPEPQPEPDLPPAATWVAPDEGVMLDDETVDAIRATIATLDRVTLSQVNDWAAEAHAAGRPFSLSREDCRTQRRFEIMRAAIALSPYDPPIQRAALAFVMGEEVQPTVTIGAALGSLTIDEATRLAQLAESLGSTIAIVYGADGPGFTGEGLAEVAA